MPRHSIAIVGGGLVGATLALALQAGARARGWTIELIEPLAPGSAYQPSYDARSTALSHGSQRVYQRLGVWPAIAAQAEPILDIHVSDRGRFGATRLNAAAEGVPALGYVIENAWLGHCLWDAINESVRRYCPNRVTEMVAQPEGYRLTLDDGRTLQPSLTVLVDGGRSDLRQQLGIGVREQRYGQTALIANVTPGHPHHGLAFERFTDEGPLALLPLTEQRCALIWTRPEGEAERLAALPERELLSELQERFGYRLGAFRQIGARHLYPLALVEADEQVRRGLVVLGNAAHSLHPIAGQGFNLSLRDAQALVDALLSTDEAPGELGALERYLAGQMLDQRLTVGFSDQVTRLFGDSAAGSVVLRNLGLVGLDLLPPAKRWFARQAMGVGER